MAINWKKLRKNIPNKIHVGYGKYFEVFWTNDFIFDGENSKEKTYGITRFEPNQIVINTNQSDRETVHTVVHEMLHALSATHDINLTETQIRKLEKCYKYLYEFNEQLNKKRRSND